MSIRSKVIAGFAFIIILFGAASFYNYSRLKESQKHLVLINELFIPLSRLVGEVQSKIGSLAQDMRRFYFHDSPRAEQNTFSRVIRDFYPYIINRKFDEAEALLEKLAKTNTPMLRSELEEKLKLSRESFSALSETRDPADFKKKYIDMKRHLQDFSSIVDKSSQEITKVAQEKGRTHLISSIALSLVVGLFGTFTVFFSLNALKPLPKLIESLKKIGDGDFLKSLKVKTSAKDEISLLAREYNRMLDALFERDKKIRSQQEELLRSERLAAIGQLLAEVVHEIRNPLNSINLNIDWLKFELSGSNEESKKALDSISREIRRLNDITESYLVRARVTAPTRQEADVHKVIDEVIRFSKEEDKDKNITVTTELSAEDFRVKTSHAKLKQVFLNLMKNAKEAMPRGGKIKVRSFVRNNTRTLEVTDTGYGMNESIKRKTFTPFYTTKENGTGLGLALTKEIVSEAQGTILCRSELGEGTTFTLEFPA